MNSEKLKKTCSVIHSGDKASKIWPVWNYYYERYWDNSVIPTIFISEEKDAQFNEIINIKTGKVDWSTGLINALESIQFKYVIYQHEDYLLTGKPDYNIINDLVELMDNNNWKLVKCCGVSAGVPEAKNAMIPTNFNVNGIPVKEYPSNLPYIISHQISIWNKEFLRETLKAGESPWEHELKGTKRVRTMNTIARAWCSKKDDPFCLPIPYLEVLKQGKPSNDTALLLIEMAGIKWE